MKKINLLLSFMLVAFLVNTGNTQIKTPAASPSATVMQTVGLVNVKLEYSRPSVKGRTIFAADGLVPLDQVWRFGANQATKLTTDGELMVNDQKLEAGSYALLALPGKSTWEVHFFNYEKSSWSSYKEKTPVAKVMVNPMSLPQSVESLTFLFANLKDDGADMMMMWDKTAVSIPLKVSTDEVVMKNIESVLAGPTKGDYYRAASYYFSAGKDLNKAYEYVKKATDGPDQKYWQLRKRSQIEAALGKYKNAIASATTSMELAEKAGNMEYVKFNKTAIAEWKNKK